MTPTVSAADMARDDRLASADIEQAFIGACLLTMSPASQADLRRVVDASCFTRTLYRAAWTRLCEAWDRGEVADWLTVATLAAGDAGVDTQTAVDRITDAATDPSCFAWTAAERGRMLRQYATRRSLVEFGSDTAKSAYTESDIEGVLAYTARVAEMLDELDARSETGEMAPIFAELERRADSGEVIGWNTGIPHIDRWSCGLRAGECWAIGGPTGTGKTWLLGQIANAMLDAGKRVAFVTLEMDHFEMTVRLVCGRIGLKGGRLSGRGRTWSADEYVEYEREKAVLSSPLMRTYSDQRSVSQIAAMVRATEPDVLFVDYVQLLDWPAGMTSSYHATTKNMNDLQRLAKRSRCALVFATQMSRAYLGAKRNVSVQGGQDAGRVDQVADLWLMIDRDSSYEDEDPRANGAKVLTCTKNRHGFDNESAKYRLDGRTGKLVPA